MFQVDFLQRLEKRFSRAVVSFRIPSGRIHFLSLLLGMYHAPLHDVVGFEIVGPYTLKSEFDDQTFQTIDFKPALAGELYAPLLELDYFNAVRLDPEAGNLVWPNGADFDPSELHDWPEVAVDYARWAEKIRKSTTPST